MPEPDGDQSDVAEPKTADQTAEPLTTWSRWLSGSLGLGLGAAGAAATFVSKNQAGSLALLLLGGVFLLMAVTAAPVHGFRIGDNEFKLALLRSRALNELSDEPPEVAERALDALAQYDPGILSDPRAFAVYARTYERLVLANVQLVYPRGLIAEEYMDRGVDAILRTEDTRQLALEVKYFREGSKAFREWVSRLQDYSTRTLAPVLLISNIPASGRSSDEGEGIQKIKTKTGAVWAVVWRSPSDNARLKTAIEKVLASGMQGGGD